MSELRGLSDMWLYETDWQKTPIWLRWLGRQPYRRKVPQDNVRPTMAYWVYSDTWPSSGGIDRSKSAIWRTRTPYEPNPSIQGSKEG